MVEPLFQISVKCINCEHDYQTSRVRPSFKKGIKTDTDFCIHYKEINPNYYVVRVCPLCGFAATENFSDKLTEAQRQTYYDKVSQGWSLRDYGRERTWEEAIQTYQLALISAQVKKESKRVIAGLLQHMAWMYRYRDEAEKEKRFLQFALDAYIEVYETEGSADVNNARLMYLIGELHRRLQQYFEAVKWFGRVINDKKIMDAAMIRACREQWIVVREDMLAAKMELPEEMQNVK